MGIDEHKWYLLWSKTLQLHPDWSPLGVLLILSVELPCYLYGESLPLPPPPPNPNPNPNPPLAAWKNPVVSKNLDQLSIETFP